MKNGDGDDASARETRTSLAIWKTGEVILEVVCWVLTMFVREGGAENVGALHRLYLLPTEHSVPSREATSYHETKKTSPTTMLLWALDPPPLCFPGHDQSLPAGESRQEAPFSFSCFRAPTGASFGQMLKNSQMVRTRWGDLPTHSSSSRAPRAGVGPRLNGTSWHLLGACSGPAPTVRAAGLLSCILTAALWAGCFWGLHPNNKEAGPQRNWPTASEQSHQVIPTWGRSTPPSQHLRAGSMLSNKT